MKIKTPRTLKKKWARHTADAASNYLAGCALPRRGPAIVDEEAAVKFQAAAAAAGGAWARGWAPYRDVLLKLKLPPRRKRGSKANVRRIAMVVNALHKEKLRRRKLLEPTGH